MVANEQFEAGAILYFDPFIFQDGGTPKRKYFVVLKRNTWNANFKLFK